MNIDSLWGCANTANRSDLHNKLSDLHDFFNQTFIQSFFSRRKARESLVNKKFVQIRVVLILLSFKITFNKLYYYIPITKSFLIPKISRNLIPKKGFVQSYQPLQNLDFSGMKGSTRGHFVLLLTSLVISSCFAVPVQDRLLKDQLFHAAAKRSRMTPMVAAASGTPEWQEEK